MNVRKQTLDDLRELIQATADLPGDMPIAVPGFAAVHQQPLSMGPAVVQFELAEGSQGVDAIRIA